MPHQAAVHRDDHQILGNFGGYGTGKTTTSREEILKHIFITPNANILIGANVTSQYEQTLKRELERDMPKAFVKDYSTQKQFMDLINGARIMYRPFDDPDKLKSYTLTMAVILEASEVKEEAYVQLSTRLRGLEATLPETDEYGDIIYDRAPDGEEIPRIKHDWRRLIAESNPDSGWIKNGLLLRSEKITQFGVDWVYNIDKNRVEKAVASFVAATRANYRLPKDFESNLRARFPDWWQKRYLEGSFQFSEGLVYPAAMNNLVPRFPIPRDWKRLVAFDYGIADDAVFVFCAVDPRTGIVFAYKCLHATNRDISALAKMYHTGAADIPVGGLYTAPIIDPKSGPKRDPDLVRLADKFLDYGINFQPGTIDVDTRIMVLNTYFEQGKFKIFDDLDFMIEEFENYKFRETSLSDTTRRRSQPVDARNHSINSAEWIATALPHDPKKLIHEVYGKTGERLDIRSFEEMMPTAWQLEDNDVSVKEERGYTPWSY